MKILNNVKLLNVLPLCLFLIFTGCGVKQKQKSKTSLTIGYGSIADAAKVAGGIMLYSENLDDPSLNFSQKFTGQDFDLPNGQWKFHAIAWKGAPFQSEQRCGETPSYLLNGAAINVNLTLTRGNCVSSRFGGRNTKATSAHFEPHPLTIKTCANEKCIFEGTGSRGVARSFKIFLPATSNGSYDVSAGIASVCLEHSGPAESLTTTFRVPAMSHGSAIVIRAYDNVGCTSGFDDAYFPNGFRKFDIPTTFFQSESSINQVSMMSNICRSTASVDGSSYRYSAADKHIICTPAHLNTLASRIATDKTHEFILGKDLDFTGISFPTPIGDSSNIFSGIFNGNGHFIKNIDTTISSVSQIGLFGVVGGVAAEISDLKLDNIKITAVNASVDEVGALIGKLQGTNSRIKRIVATDITVDTSGSACSGDGCQSIGGLIGLQVEGEAYDISMDNITLKTDNLAVGVGGIIGKLNYHVTGTALRHSEIKNITFSHPTSGGSHSFGGAVGISYGELHDIKTSIFIDKDSVPFFIDSSLGGVVGKIGDPNARIEKLKAEGVFNISGISKVGGVIGHVTNANSMVDLIGIVQITAGTTGNDIGGTIGRLALTTIGLNLSRLISFGDIFECPSGCGGIIGYVNDAGRALVIDNAHSYGNVTSSSGNDIGGVIGQYLSTHTGTFLQYSHSEGNVSGYNNVGGLIGKRTAIEGKGQVQTVYTLGSVSASLAAPALGGLIGNTGTFNGGDISEFYTQAYITSASHGTGPASVQVDFGSYTQGGGSDVATAANTKCYYNSLVTDTNYTTRTACSGIDFTADTASNIGSFYPLFTGANWVKVPGTTSLPPALKEHMPYMVLGDDKLGSEIDPYELFTIHQWNIIGDNADLLDQSFKLMADLDFSGETFVPIASTAFGFTGHFRGNNHTIKNIILNESVAADKPLGIFRKLGDSSLNKGARIEDGDEGADERKLYLENINFTGYNGGTKSFVGTLAGLVEDGTGAGGNEDEIRIERVVVTGGYLNSFDKVGGVIGELNYKNPSSKISHLSSSSSIESCGSQFSGGIIGTTVDLNTLAEDSLDLESLEFSGTIDCASTNFVGGIIGKIQHNSLKLEKVINSGNIIGQNYVGGLVGNSHGKIEQGKNSGNITGNDYVGGLAGETDTDILGSYSLGNMLATTVSAAVVGGLVGNCNSCSVKSSYSNVESVLDNNGDPGGSMFGFGDGATSTSFEKSFYLGAVDSIANGKSAFRLTSSGDIYNTSITSGLLNGDESWILEDGETPKLIYEVYPIYFDH